MSITAELRRHGLVLFAVLVLASLPATAQLVFQGGEFLVNAHTPLSQSNADVAPAGNGFVVVWGSDQQDGSMGGIFGRRFSNVGSPVAGEFQVTLYTVGQQHNARVAMLASGFVVTWTSDEQDGEANGVFGRLFAANGSPVGAEFQVATRTTGAQRRSSVAGDGAGGFVVVWDSLGDYNLEGVFGQRFSSSGARVGEQFQVNSYITDRQVEPAVAEHEPGFVVVWQSENGQDGDAIGIFGQRFDSYGSRLGGEFQANSRTLEPQDEAVVASNGSGFVVLWRSPSLYGMSGREVYGRRFNTGGAAQASEFRVNDNVPLSQRAPDLAANGASYLVVWDVEEVVGRRLDGLGFPTGGDSQINTLATNYQIFPSVARVDGSGFVVVWTSLLQDGSSYGIFGRRLGLSADFDIDGNGTVDALTDGLLALRYAFGFRGATLITAAVGAGCTRCDAPSIEAYLAGRV